jgi:hypothetical protein
MEDFNEYQGEIEVVERRVVKRITLSRIFTSIFEAFNLERGGFFTIKALLINPGKAIKEYLGENRFHYTPPFRVLIITTALALYLISISNTGEHMSDDFIQGIDDPDKLRLIQDKLFSFFGTYANFILWTFIPIAALFTFLFNRKRGYNFAEHLVFQTYLFCVANMLTVFIPLSDFISNKAGSIILTGLMVIYYTYAYKVFLNRSVVKSVWDTLSIMFIATVIWSLLLIAAFMLFVLTNKELFS